MSALVLALAVRRGVRKPVLDRDWEEAAAECGLEYVPPSAAGPQEIRARYEGEPIRVRTVVRSGNHGQFSHTVAQAAIRAPVPYGFCVSRPGADIAIGKSLRGQDIEIGDAFPDPMLRVKAINPSACCTDTPAPA